MYAAKANPTGGQTTMPEDKAVYEAFVKAMDSNIERSVPGYKDVRQTYQIQKLLDPAKTNQGVFDLAKISNEIRKMEAKNPSILDNLGQRGEQLRGLANFADHAKMANTSGTAENTLAQKIMLNPYVGQLLLGGAGGGAGAGLSYSQGGDPLQGLMVGTAAGLGAPIVANTLLQTGIKGLAPDAAKSLVTKYPWLAEILARSRNAPINGLLGE
jgi:hypothetical protein